MSEKSMQLSFNLYLFFILSIISFSAFAGVDPDEANLEDDMKTKEVKKQELVEKENAIKETLTDIIQEVAEVTNNCVSFPEAVAFKEHFACSSDIEKLRLARLNWSFVKLINQN